MSDKPLVHIYTDGGCSPNPGPGGWAAVLIAPKHNNRRKELYGAEWKTTNNRMELTAVIEALRALKRPCKVIVHTDSRYLCDAFTCGWLARWNRNGWKTQAKQDVLNVDLWKELQQLCRQHEVSWRWVKSHANNRENNRCDALVRRARDELLRKRPAAQRRR